MIYLKKIITFVLIFLFALFLFKTDVFAYNTTSSYFNGYTSFQKYTVCDGDVLGTRHRVLCDGVTDAMVSDNGIFSKTKFINYIEGLLSTVGTTAKAYNKRLGASFIIHTMLGKPQSDGSVVPTATEIADWKNRMNSTSLFVSGEIYSYTLNSTFVKSSTGFYDDKFYSDTDTADSWVFRIGGSTGPVVYSIKKVCANPLGSLPGIPDPPPVVDWKTSVSSSANMTVAKPGDTITWNHSLSNSGTTNTNASVTYHFQNRGDLGAGSGPDGSIASGWPVGVAQTFNSTYTVLSTDVNKNLCRATSVNPTAWNNAAWNESAAACVYVTYDYNLIPSVSVNPSGVVETGASFTVTTLVNNSGSTVNSPTATWALTRTVSQPGFGDTSTAQNGSGLIVTAGGSVAPVAPIVDTDTDKLVGTRICYVLSINPYTNVNNNSASSQPACVIVGKKPKVQILGGDLWAGGFVQTSQTVKGISTFGSWDQYGIFSAGAISGMASGSAFAGTVGLENSTVCGYSNLSFTNTPAGGSNCTGSVGSIGNYASSKTIPDVAASFPTNVSTPSVTSNLDNLQGVYTASGSATISGGTIKKGQWIVINAVNADITISGNINYTNGPYNVITDIPQVVIIANNINIADSVTNIDAWLIAKNDINTCSTAGNSALTSSMCNQLLTINGPVMASKLFLRRTAGSGLGAASGDPAEIINLRSDAYLWASVRSGSAAGRIQTVYSTELPPRF